VRTAAGLAAWLLLFSPTLVAAQELPYSIGGDAIPTSLTGVPGDAASGRAIIANRQVGLCLLCHTGPFPEERFQGNLAPSMSGAGSRWSEGQLRLRLVDAGRLNAASIMPAYYRTAGLNLVTSAAQGKPLLTAQQIEDVVAFLRTLKE
jgi:L-cysteine S-thiosulfotransferase